jgi:hypothetical protein
VLEILPLAALLLIIALHPDQFLSLFGIGADVADYTIRLKDPPLPWLYVSIMLTLVFLFEVLPYIEELVRGLRARKRDFEG